MLILPYVWWIQRRTRSHISLKHLLVCTVVRSTIVLMLIASLMQPFVDRQAEPLSIVYALDVSWSVAPNAIQSALNWIQEANRIGRPAHERFIAFGGNSAVFANLEQLKDVDITGRPGTTSIDQSATNIQDAIDRAMGNFAPHHLKRLVLITDGNGNASDMPKLRAALKREGVKVYTIPAATRDQGDAWVESVSSPLSVRAAELFPLEVDVYAQTPGASEVEIRNGNRTLDRRQVLLNKGLNRVEFETQITGDGGPVTLEAEVRAAGDPFPENNTFRKGVLVQGQPKILYLEAHKESAHSLEQALKAEGLTTDVRAANQIRISPEELSAYDAVVISDLPRSSLTDQEMSAIRDYVWEGGGLIFAGGENSYGQQGYFGTALERSLPVTFETRKQNAVALIVVFDKSGSMAGYKLGLGKEATKASAAILKDTDRFGVVAFDQEFYWPVPLQSASNRDAINQAISTIAAGGETNMYPPLHDAFLQLKNARTQIKHVILMSDGVSLPGDFEQLAKEMAAAKITVSTVALGMASDKSFLAKIAEWGKGRSYYIEDGSKVAQIFTDETQLAARTTLRENSFKPLVKKYVNFFKGIDLDNAPPLLGYAVTKARKNSEIILESGDHDPVLARWQYGLGKAVVFTSDFKDRWGAEWLRWDSYGKFWSQLVRETMRVHDNDDFDFQVERDTGRAKITISAIQPDGQFRNELQPFVRVVTPDGSVSVINVNQVGPGFHETVVPLTQKGSYVFRGSDGQTVATSRILPYSYPDEYHFYDPNVDLLRSISSDTGGKFEPAPGEIFEAGGETTSVPMPLAPYFAGVALLLFFVDVFLRRIRLFES